MILVTVIGFLPVNMVYAFYQQANKKLELTDLTDGTLQNSNNYKIRYVFDKAEKSSIPNGLNDAPPPNDKVKYDVFFWNITTGGLTMPKSPLKTHEDTAPYDYTENYTLDNGSIYKFIISPWHLEIVNPDPLNYQTRKSTLEVGTSNKEVAYLTEVRASFKGAGKSVTATWDNPTVSGAEVFTGYKISYSVGGASANLETGTNITIDASDPLLIRNAGKLSYTFTDDNILPATPYAIKVVPLKNGVDVTKNETTIRVGNNDIPLVVSKRQNRINDLYLEPKLTIKKEGSDFIKLEWDLLNSPNSIVKEVKIESSTSDNMSSKTLAYSLKGSATSKINYWVTEKPKQTLYFQATYIYTNGSDPTLYEMKTNIARYDPVAEEYSPIAPTILKVVDNSSSILITFMAFQRKALTNDEKAVADKNGYIIDKNVLYDFYVTDDLLNFENSNMENFKIVSDLDAKTLTEYAYNYSILGKDFKSFVYDLSVNSYTQKDKNGSFVTKPLEENKVYYIKAVAKKVEPISFSNPAFFAHYLTPKGNLSLRPITLSKPPLEVSKNDKEVEEITENSIKIKWEKSWFEVFNPEDGNWYSTISVEDGVLLFGNSIKNKANAVELFGSKFGSSNNQNDGILAVKKTIESLGFDSSNLAVRFMDLENANYQIHVTKYDEINTHGGFENYVKNLTTDLYAEITPEVSENSFTYLIESETKTNSPLEKNTSYIAFLKPYKIINGEKVESYFPSFIIATTSSNRDKIDVTPTVPELFIVSSTDTSINIKFDYKKSLSYELYYSESISDYPEKGILITNEEILKNSQIKEEKDNTTGETKSYLYVEIKNLFPETNYHIWLRSKTNVLTPNSNLGFENLTGEKYSAFSNAVSEKTKEIKPPKPPQGLGLARDSNVIYYNKESGKNYKALSHDYIIVEFFRDTRDVETNATQTSTENPSAEFLIAKLSEQYMIKFNKDETGNPLSANRIYYFRAKTEMAIQKAEGKISTSFYYIVQMSQSDDFKSFVEIVVPSTPVKGKVGVSKSSEFSETVTIKTEKTKGEYDGENSVITAPLPLDDVEIIFDNKTSTLFYRFRSDKFDKSGDYDNLVDNRLISELIKEKKYNLEVDVSNYENINVENKVITIPFSIIKALSTNKINLSIKSTDSTYVFKPDFIMTREVKEMSEPLNDAFVVITINNVSDNLSLENNDVILSEKENLSIQIQASDNVLKLTQTANPFEVITKIPKLRLNDDVLYVNSYTKSDLDLIAKKENEILVDADFGSGIFSYKRTKLGIIFLAGNLDFN